MPFSSRSGGTRNRARERVNEHSDFQRVDKEAPSMQIKCCFHNHSSVPLSEVRFFVIKVKGTFTRGCIHSFAPTNQPANQPADPTTHLPDHHPSTNYPFDFNNRKLWHALCPMLIKRSLLSTLTSILFSLRFHFGRKINIPNSRQN